MFSLFRKIRTIFKQYAQILFVVIAFALMVVSSYLYVGNIERKNLQENVKDVIFYTEAKIKADLLEPETILAGIAQTVCGMILRGDDAEEIQDHVLYINNYVQSNEENRLLGVIGFYGVFDAHGKKFTVGEADCVPESFELQDCPWYHAAVEANGGIGISQPHVDTASGEGSMTFSRRIFDSEGKALGVVCLDINLDRIQRLVIDTHFAENGFGLLLNENLEIIAHPNHSLLGMPLRNVNIGIAASDVELRRHGSVSEFKTTDYLGVESVLSIEKLYNGWYMGIITPKDRYYQETKNLAIMLTILGIILSSALIMILLRISAEKDKADERVRVMFDAMPLGAGYHSKNFKVLDCNKRTLNLFGLSNKQEYIDTFYDLSPEYQPDGSLSSEKMSEYVDKALAEGYCCVEWTHRNANGEPIPCEVTLVRVKQDNEFALLAYMRDLRELKAAVTQMNQSRQSLNILENILNGLDAMVYVTVPQTGEILFINNYMKEHYNIEGDCIGQLCYKIFQQGDAQCDCCPCRQLDREPHSTVVWEERNILTNRVYRNTDRYIEWPDGRTVHIQHSVDVTELISTKEQAVQTIKEKNGFLAQMSHEIRTPMNAILGITEIQLQNEALPPEMREALDRIYNAGYLLMGIINNILDLYNVEAGKLELTPVKYNVASLINDVIHLSVTRFENKAVEFVLQVDENIPSSLVGDDLRIKQILNNLLSNSFKYTDSGKVSLSIAFENESGGNAFRITLVLRVSDTGRGMTAEQVDRLFDDYFNTEINRSTERAGLGMSITKRLVSLMGGEITVESEPGKGSAFTVRLPQEIADGGILGTALAENLRQFRLGKTPQIIREYMPYGKVLVVDDIETNLYVARGLMAPYGLSVETAASGFETVDRIRNGASYDVIFMDHFMPGMDGMEAARIIRGLGYTHPIIALTANILAGQGDTFLANGFDWFISKPIDTRQLNTALNKFIRDKYPPEVVKAARRYEAILAKPKEQPLSEHELAIIFAQDAEKAIAVLESIHANNYRRNDDIQLYVITVHAMKNALVNIGETELFAMALNLERAGREGNIAEMAAGTPAFFDALRALIDRNKPKDKDEEAADDIRDDEREYLRKKLYAIQLACTAYDKRTANEALIDLREKKWPHPERELLDAITKHLLHSEFEEIVSLLTESSREKPV